MESELNQGEVIRAVRARLIRRLRASVKRQVTELFFQECPEMLECLDETCNPGEGYAKSEFYKDSPYRREVADCLYYINRYAGEMAVIIDIRSDFDPFWSEFSSEYSRICNRMHIKKRTFHPLPKIVGLQVALTAYMEAFHIPESSFEVRIKPLVTSSTSQLFSHPVLREFKTNYWVEVHEVDQ